MERKNPHRLQAQGEEFAHRRVEAFSYLQELFLKYSATISQNLIDSPEDIPPDFPEDLREAIAEHWDQYVVFLSDATREDELAIRLAERNAALYDRQFSADVKELIHDIEADEAEDRLLGSGVNGEVYLLKQGTREYAVKFDHNVSQANFELRALRLAKGIPQASQLVTYSFADQAVIMKRLPGKNVRHLPPEVLNRLKDQQITDLVRTVLKLAERGLEIDPNPENFLYDRFAGFSVLDYHSAQGQGLPAAVQVMLLKEALCWKQDDDPSKVPTEQRAIERRLFYLPRLIRFVTVLEEQFPQVVQDWKSFRVRMKRAPNQIGGAFLTKENVVMSDPRVARYVHQLEELDGGWVFE